MKVRNVTPTSGQSTKTPVIYRTRKWNLESHMSRIIRVITFFFSLFAIFSHVFSFFKTFSFFEFVFIETNKLENESFHPFFIFLVFYHPAFYIYVYFLNPALRIMTTFLWFKIIILLYFKGKLDLFIYFSLNFLQSAESFELKILILL